jgi:signal transduction histidine kinase
VSIVEPSAAEKELGVVLQTPAGTIPLLRGDTVRIKQIVLNLLTNAVKFTDQGQVEVVLDATAAPGGVRLSISVGDTGVGIPAGQLEHIFNSFYQIDSTVTRRYGGAGLGLAITRRLVEAMGGAIEVSSEPGVGSVFAVELTLPPAEVVRAAE